MGLVLALEPSTVEKSQRTRCVEDPLAQCRGPGNITCVANVIVREY